jgi:hypothetical protein
MMPGGKVNTADFGNVDFFEASLTQNGRCYHFEFEALAGQHMTDASLVVQPVRPLESASGAGLPFSS